MLDILPLHNSIVTTPFESVDPFHGTGAVDQAEPEGIARAWNWRKAQTGNCHPGACYPFGMVSACPYSGMYPTGYGINDMSWEGAPRQLLPNNAMDGVTHFHVSGTGNVKNFYNYFKISPLPYAAVSGVKPESVEMVKEHAEPGYYSCLTKNNILTELTVSKSGAAHRYSGVKSIIFDVTHGGLRVLDEEPYISIPEDISIQCDGTSCYGFIVMRGLRYFIMPCSRIHK